MGGYTLPIPDDGMDPMGGPQGGVPYGYGYSPYGGGPIGAQQSSMGFNVSGPQVMVDPNSNMENIFAMNRNAINSTGNVIAGQAGNALNYYGGLQGQLQGAQNTSLNQLNAMPGYSPDEASQIGADYSQFNTTGQQFGGQFLTGDEQNSIYGNPYGAANAQTQGIGAEGAMLNQYQQGLGAQLGQYSSYLGGARDQFAQGLGGAAQGFQAGVGGAAQRYGQGVGAAAQGSAAGVRGAEGQMGQNVGGALQGMASGMRGGVQTLGQGLQDAQGRFSGLDQAVNDPSLGFDPNNTEQQMTDQDVQNMRTSAGVSAGNQFRTAEDTLERQAAQAGNTSPAALAAMRQSLVTQQAATAGDVENNAEIAARNAQFQRAAAIEQQRFGSAATRQGMKATASTTEEAAAQAAAGLYGTSAIGAEQSLGQTGVGAGLSMGQSQLGAELGLGGQQIGAQEAIGGANLNAQSQIGQANMNAQSQIGNMGFNAANLAGQANIQGIQNYGQFSTNQANTMTGQQYQALTAADQAAAQRAAMIGTNRQATQTGINSQMYQQGVNSQQLNSQGQQALGQARIAGQNAYRSGISQQQGMAQQGGQAAQQTQLGAYGTQTSGLNANTSGQAGFEVGKASFGDQLAKVGAGVIGTGLGLFEKGGIATEPTLAKLGEHGPEMVVPLDPQYARYRRRPEEEEAA